MTVPDLPGPVTATRDGAKGAWRYGAARDPTDPHWLVLTGDPLARRRGHSAVIRHDAPVAPDITLASASMATDAAVRRALCSFAVTQGFGGGSMSAPVVASLLCHHDWALRWRIDAGFGSWHDVAPADLRDFIARLTAGGLLGLVDLAARVDSVDADDLARTLDFRRGRAGAQPLAILLGLGFILPSGGLEAVSTAWRSRQGLAPSVDTPVPLRRSAAALFGHLAFWSNLRSAAAAGAVADGPSFDPFAQDNGPRSVANRLGSTGGRTPTVEPRAFLRLLAAATRCVLSEGPETATAIARAASTEVDGDRQAAAVRARRVMTAAAILVGGLAARRGNEVTSVRRGALRIGPRGPELRMTIEKSTIDVDWVAVPALVAEGVAIVEGFARRAGDVDGQWLFRLRLPWGRLVDVDPASDFATFATAEGLHEGLDALGPPLTSHQLRRAAAILFELAYRLGTPAGLARLLRHAGEGAGTIYVTGATPGRMDALRDGLAAGTRAAIAAIDGGQAARLSCLRARLHDRRHPEGPVPAAEKYGAGPSKLLDAWAAKAAGGACAHPGASLGVRIGSRVATPDRDPRPLLVAVREHAAALAASRVLP